MAGETLFGKRAILQLDGDTAASYECGSPDGLDIDFSVRKTLKRGPNKATISLYNPSRETSLYAILRDRELRVRLFAGYGDNIGMLIEGNPVKRGIEIIRDGPDRILRIEMNDCLRKYQTGRVKFTIRGTTTLGEVVDRTLAQLGIPKGTIDIPRDLPIGTGWRASGPARETLDRIAGMVGADWTYHNGTLEMMVRKGAKVTTGPLYSSANRSIYGWPSKTKDGISATVPLDANMRPGKGFTLEMEEGYYNGAWRAKDVVTRGSTRGTSWETQIEAKRWR